MHITAIRPEIEDGITDELPGPVVGDVAAASGLMNLNAFSRERGRRRDDVRAAAASFGAEGDDWRMLEQQQRVANPSGAPIFDQLALHLERRGVLDSPQPPDVNRHFR
jgi:hypothetical protein